MYTKHALIESIKYMTEVCEFYANTLNDECNEDYILRTFIKLKYHNKKILSEIMMYEDGECEDNRPERKTKAMTENVKNMIIESIRTASVVLDQEIQELVKDIDNDSEFKYHLQVIEDIFKRNYDKTKLHIRWIEDEDTPFDPPYTIEESK